MFIIYIDTKRKQIKNIQIILFFLDIISIFLIYISWLIFADTQPKPHFKFVNINLSALVQPSSEFSCILKKMYVI